MRRSHRFTSFLLLFLFTFLSFKNLFPQFSSDVHSDCQEFGHIHMYQTPVVHHPESGPELLAPHAHDDECHEAKFFSMYSVTPVQQLDLQLPKFRLVYQLIFKLENYFPNPDLEPRRKPPRLA